MQDVTPITADRFWQEFSDGLAKRLRLSPDWSGHFASNKAWTSFMKEFLCDLGHELGFADVLDCVGVSTEWCNVDVGYFGWDSSRVDGANTRIPLEHWNWDVAIEHENDTGFRWIEEFVKLVHINCGLRVLITYNDYGRHKVEDKLSLAERIWARKRYARADQEWTIIIGPDRADDPTKDFVGYKLSGGRMVELPQKGILRTQ